MANTGGGPVILYGVGGGRFSTQRTVISSNDTDGSVVDVGDFNGDGIPDILSGSYGSSRMTVLVGHPDGRFAVGGQYSLRGAPTKFEIADFNSDGHPDVAARAYLGGYVTILLGNGHGTFREAPPVPAATIALTMLAADFNGDRIPDLAVTEGLPGLAPGSLLPGGSVNILPTPPRTNCRSCTASAVDDSRPSGGCPSADRAPSKFRVRSASGEPKVCS